MNPLAPTQNNAAPEVAASSTAPVISDSPSAYADGRQVVKNLAWLKTLPRYLNFKIIEQPDGSLDKKPFNPVTGQAAACDNPDTWVNYPTAKAAEQRGEGCIGFALGKDVGLIVVDFDKVRPTKNDPWPQWVLDEIQAIDSYTEVSASGRGFHVLVWGAIAENFNRNQVEIWDSVKMFALTGDVFQGRATIQTHDVTALWERIRDKKVRPAQTAKPTVQPATTSGIVVNMPKPYVPMAERAAKLEKALTGDTGDYGHNTSAAVFGVLQLLARKHAGNKEAMRVEMEASDLSANWQKGKDDKWERLGDAEIDKAVAEWQKNGSPPWEDSKPLAPTIQLKGEQVEGGDFDFVLNALAGSDDGWFPRGDISLLAAASGGGKTTIALELLDKQFRGEDVYGHSTNKLPYLILLQDRGQRGLRRTLKRMRIDATQLPYRMIGYGDKVAAVEEAILATMPRPAVVFIEGIDLLEGDSGKGQNVEALLSRLFKVAEHYHVAIIGSTGCPKMKPKDRYTSLRDTVIGSSVWSRKVETILTLQKENGKETDDITLMTVLPRNAKVEEFRLTFEDGRLKEAPKAPAPLAEPTPEDFLRQQKGKSFARIELQASLGWKQTRAQNWLALGVAQKRLVKEGKNPDIKYCELSPKHEGWEGLSIGAEEIVGS